MGSPVPEGLSTFSVGPAESPSPPEPGASPSPQPGPPAAPGAPGPPPPPPAGRTARLGEAFSIRIGEMVEIAGEDLVVTYSRFLSDNRCPPDARCIVRGNARISVRVGSDSDPPATLALNTDEGPGSGTYLDYRVELVSLGRGNAPSARLRVT